MKEMKLIKIEMPQFNSLNIWVEEIKTKEIEKIKKIVSFAQENKIENHINWYDLTENLFYTGGLYQNKKLILRKENDENDNLGSVEYLIEIFQTEKNNYIINLNCQSQCYFNREGITIINFDNKQDLITFLEQDGDCNLLNVAASCFGKELWYQLFQQIINDNFNNKMLVTYISKILEDDYKILSLREEFNFFFDKSVKSIVDDIYEKKYTDIQEEHISLVSNHLEIILDYFESDKQITPLFIEKVTLFRDKIPCLSTILDIITKNNSKKIEDIENNLSKVWMYKQLIDILEKLPLFQDKECIKQQNEIIDNYITKLNIEKKSIDGYKNDRENLINEIISDITTILNKPKDF